MLLQCEHIYQVSDSQHDKKQESREREHEQVFFFFMLAKQKTRMLATTGSLLHKGIILHILLHITTCSPSEKTTRNHGYRP